MSGINVANDKRLVEFHKITFKGRTDVVARYWKSKDSEQSGYVPICGNEWQEGVCQKSRKPCRDCPNKDYVQLTDTLLINHLKGKHILGVYPLLQDNTCWFLAFDFDNHDGVHDPFRDVKRFYEICEVQGILCYVLRSKSGTGFHVYIFFDGPVPAWKARLVGFALLHEAQAVDDDNTTISSLDRMFPGQDELTPTKPLGNLISLPFQGKAAQDGHTLFLEPATDFQQPFQDQLEILKTITRVPENRLDEIIKAWGLVRNIARPQKPQPAKARTKTVTPTIAGKISAGRRNTTLSSIAGSLRRKGMEYEQIKEVLLEVNQEQCEPPLETPEVEKIAESISRYEAGPGTEDRQDALAAAKETLTGLADKVKSEPGEAFEPSILLALGVVRQKDPGEWAKLRKMLKEAEISLRDLDRAIKKASALSQDGNFNDGPGRLALAHPYLVSNGILAMRHRTSDGEFIHPLCNFNAHLVGERLVDDGLTRTTIFKVEGQRQDGQQLPPIEIPAAVFPGMSWVTSNWGARAVVNAGQSAKDHVRAAIQLLSGEVPQELVYGHLGWKKIGKEWVYLHGGGGIGQNGLISDLALNLGDGRLNEYILPAPATGEQLKMALQASLRLFALAPATIVSPLIAGIYRAPLAEILPVDLALFISGSTGNRKSELTAQAQAHFGAGFHRMNLPGNWLSTANALEKQAFLTKDTIFVVDDFNPVGTVAEKQAMHSKADRLLRAQGNRTGRARMRADGSLRPEYYPKGLILTSGEDIPQGHSLRGRLLILEVAPGEVNLEVLTQMQGAASSGLLAQAMSTYLQWLAPQLDSYKSKFPETVDLYKRIARKELSNARIHSRTPDTVASLMAGLDVFITLIITSGVLPEKSAAKILEQGITALLETARAQGRHLDSEDPTRMFFRLLMSAISSGAAHLASVKGDQPPKNAITWGWRRKDNDTVGELQRMGQLIGWVDEDNVYLEPETTYAIIQNLARSHGASFPVTAPTLWKRLAEKDLLASTEPDHNTVRRMINGKRPRVIHLHAATLGVVINDLQPWDDKSFDDVAFVTPDQYSDETGRPVHH